MAKGDTFKDPEFNYQDQASARSVRQLTDYRGHSNHLYFTDPCWIADSQTLIFTSDRNNSSNLYTYELADGSITQLTEFDGSDRPSGCYCNKTGKHYLWWNDSIIELEVETLKERVVYTAPEGWNTTVRPAPTSDGLYVCVSIWKNPTPVSPPEISYSYSRFRELFDAKPLTRIVRINTETCDTEIIHEDYCYIGHINTSPTIPIAMTFCHEGPWSLVDQRMWGLNIATGEHWKIRDQHDDISIGHEYWFAGGQRIGYHGRRRTGDLMGTAATDHTFGIADWETGSYEEVAFPYHSTHFHSLNEHLIVGDGTPFCLGNDQSQPYIQLYQRQNGSYVGPKVLAFHRSSFNDQHAHCHPRFTPDGKHVLYSSDLTSYSNMYLVEVGDFIDLPDLEGILQGSNGNP